jgi:hypothetical protein
MLTIQPSALSMVRLTALEPGDLFQYSGSHGDYIAMLVENEAQQYASWLRLTGDQQFRMEDVGHGGAFHYVHAPKVLRLGIRCGDLRVRIDQARLVPAAAGTLQVGALLIQEHPRIVTRFGDGELDEMDAYGVSLADLSRESVYARGGYVCDKWQLVHVRQDSPPELIAEFSPPTHATPV